MRAVETIVVESGGNCFKKLDLVRFYFRWRNGIGIELAVSLC